MLNGSEETASSLRKTHFPAHYSLNFLYLRHEILPRVWEKLGIRFKLPIAFIGGTSEALAFAFKLSSLQKPLEVF